MKNKFIKNNKSLIFQIFLLIVLLVAYISIDPLFDFFNKQNELGTKDKSVQTQSLELLENESDLKRLNKINNAIEEIDKNNKDDLNSFILHSKSGEKIKALLEISPEDKGLDIYINDNLKMYVKKDAYPVTVYFKSAVYKFMDQSFYAKPVESEEVEGAKEGFLMKKDIMIEDLGYFENEKVAINELRDYLYNGMGEKHFLNLIDDSIEKEIENRNDLLNSLQ